MSEKRSNALQLGERAIEAQRKGHKYACASCGMGLTFDIAGLPEIHECTPFSVSTVLEREPLTIDVEGEYARGTSSAIRWNHNGGGFSLALHLDPRDAYGLDSGSLQKIRGALMALQCAWTDAKWEV